MTFADERRNICVGGKCRHLALSYQSENVNLFVLKGLVLVGSHCDTVMW